MKLVYALMLACVLVTTSCAAALSLLPDVVAAVTDGMQIIEAIERFCNLYFIKHPDPHAEMAVGDAIAKARDALNVALRTAQGAKELNDKQVDAAFEDFKQAYIALLGLVRSYGVTEATMPTKPTLRVQEGRLVVPSPMAFNMKKGG